MAKDKKSFIAYCDWLDTFEELPDEIAGKLAKHLFRYVNDLDPKTDDVTINATFAGMKRSLKRDLEKYNHYIDKQKVNGAKGGRPKSNPTEPKKPKPLFKNPTEPKKPDSVSVSVSESEIYKYTLEREVLNSVSNLFDKSHYSTDSKKQKWLDTIRLCLNNDNRDKQQLIDVIKFARADEFWKGNFLTINSLRKKNSDGIMKYDSILAKMPKAKKKITGKYPEATYEQIATGLKSEFQAKENIKQGIRYIMNGPMLTKVRTDSQGDFIYNSNAQKERL